MRELLKIAAGSTLVLAALTLIGCGDQTPAGNELLDPAETKVQTSEADQELGASLSTVINDANTKYRPMSYDNDENLLAILDRVETRLAGKSKTLDPLPMANLDEAEQLDHFKETIRLWSEKTKRNLRETIDPLKADVAARAPGGQPFHPDFHKKFAAAFDDFIPLEIAEIRERRNRVIHEKTRPILDQYRGSSQAAVLLHEKTLNSPPYDLHTGPTADAK